MRDMDLIGTKTLEERRNKIRAIKVPNLPNEKWVDVLGFEGHYMVSNFQRIKSLCRIVNRKDGVTILKAEQIRKPHLNSDGYVCFTLVKEGIEKSTTLHIIVAESFKLPNPNNHKEINHKDGNKQNCRPDNLEYGTHKHNMNHAVKSGLIKYKKGRGLYKKFKLKQQDIIDIYKSKELSKALAKKYKITRSSIQRIRNGKTYSKITKEGGNVKTCYHKLSQSDADAIRKSNLTQRELVAKYNISKGLVYNIKNNISYKWT